MNQNSHPDFIEYKNPKLGLFVYEKESDLPGWHTEDKQLTIIGETKEHYMYDPYYVEEEGAYHLCGVHKGRFIKWLPTQQELF